MPSGATILVEGDVEVRGLSADEFRGREDGDGRFAGLHDALDNGLVAPARFGQGFDDELQVHGVEDQRDAAFGGRALNRREEEVHLRGFERPGKIAFGDGQPDLGRDRPVERARWALEGPVVLLAGDEDGPGFRWSSRIRVNTLRR